MRTHQPGLRRGQWRPRGLEIHPADYAPLLLNTGFAADLRGSSLDAVIESGRPRVINDLEKYLRAHPQSASSRLIVAEGMRSNLTCPLRVEDRHVGFLFSSARRTNAYDAHQVRLHLAIVQRLSQAVEKAYHIAQLTEANQAYFEMLGFVSHELKSPLASVVMDADVLVDGYLGELAPPQRAKLERMTHKCNYLLGLVGDYLNLSRLESGPLEPEFRRVPDFIAEVIEPAIGLVAPQLEAKGVQLHRHWSPDVIAAECAPDLLHIVLSNLLSNAIKYGNDGGEVRVHVELEATRLCVAVWNEGPGFPDEEQPKLFRKFSRLKTRELLQRKGTGVGLYTSWRIIQSHFGQIRARSELGAWAEFSFEIPQPIGSNTQVPR